MTEGLLQSDAFVELVAHVVKKEADGVIYVSSKREEQIKTFPRAADRAASTRLSSRIESPPTDISSDRTYERSFFVSDTDEEKRPRRRMEEGFAAQRKNKN